jgi:hypothetical protein
VEVQLHAFLISSGAHPASYPMGIRGSFHDCKAASAWSCSLASIQCRGQECVELYLHSPNTPSWRDAQLNQRENFTFYLYLMYSYKNFFPLDLKGRKTYRRENCITMNFTACILHRILLGWLNQGGWGGRDMWHAWGRGEVFTAVFLNRRAAARYWALGSIIPGRERFSWNLSF